MAKLKAPILSIHFFSNKRFGISQVAVGLCCFFLSTNNKTFEVEGYFHHYTKLFKNHYIYTKRFKIIQFLFSYMLRTYCIHQNINYKIQNTNL